MISIRQRLQTSRSSHLRRGLAHQWRDAQGSDAIAVAAQHAEAEAMKRKRLAGLRDRTRLGYDETRDGGGLITRHIPFHSTLDIARRSAAFYVHAAARL